MKINYSSIPFNPIAVAPMGVARTSLNKGAVLALVKSIMAAGALHAQTPAPTVSATSAAPSASTPAAALTTTPNSFTAPATSSEPTTQLPAVVVEAQAGQQISSPKFTQPLLDTPQTIAVIPREVFTQQGAVNLSDVLRNTPGITFTAGEGGSVASGDTFTMRGFDTSGSIFVDGVRDTGAYSRDVFNLEQVEIAKGPAGADNGRGGSSGYVNLSTKSPQLEIFLGGTVAGGSADQKRTTFDANSPLDGSPLAGTAVRLNAVWQDGGVPGRDYVSNASWAIAPSLAIGLGTPTRFILAASVGQQNNLPDSGLPVVALPGGIPTTPPTGPVAQSNFFGLVGRDFEHVSNESLTARVEHDFSAALKVSNQTRYASTDRDALTTFIQNSAAASFSASTGIVTPRRIRNESYNNIISNQTNLTAKFATGPVAHALSAGLEFSREAQTTPTWSGVNGPSTDIHNPDPFRPASLAQTPFRAANNPYAKADTDTVAAYAFDTMQLHPKLLLDGSVRWERFHTRAETLAAPTTTVASPVVARNEARGELVSWKAGLVFKPRPEGSLYVAYGNSFTPPGSGFALSTAANNQNNPNLKPQEATNLETGVKWDFFKGRLSTSLALYRSENKNVVSTDSTTLLVTQDISQTVEGAELGVSGRITGDWLVFGGVGFMDTEQHSAGTTAAATTDGAGLRFAPRLSGNLWTTYALARGFTLGGGAQYSDSVARSNNAGVTATSLALPATQSYWIFNLLAAYEVNQRLTLRLNVNNVTDARYIRLNNNGGRYYPGTPRAFLLTAEYKF